MKAQRVQKSTFNEIKEAKDFDEVKKYITTGHLHSQSK